MNSSERPTLHPHDEIKFVIADHADYSSAKRICEDCNPYDRVSNVLLSPAFGSLDLKELVRWMLEDKLPTRLNLQIHKVIWSLETKGV